MVQPPHSYYHCYNRLLLRIIVTTTSFLVSMLQLPHSQYQCYNRLILSTNVTTASFINTTAASFVLLHLQGRWGHFQHFL
jgi:hypothetical protein